MQKDQLQAQLRDEMRTGVQRKGRARIKCDIDGQYEVWVGEYGCTVRLKDGTKFVFEPLRGTRPRRVMPGHCAALHCDFPVFEKSSKRLPDGKWRVHYCRTHKWDNGKTYNFVMCVDEWKQGVLVRTTPMKFLVLPYDRSKSRRGAGRCGRLR